MTITREVNPVDVLFVGAGPASLAGAIHLARLVKAHNAKGVNVLAEPVIAVLEKSAEVGYHGFSGAVLDPSSLRKLFPDLEAAGVPLESPVTEDELWWLTARHRIKAPITPPPMNNHGNYVISLQKLVAFMATKAEEEGVTVAAGFPAAELLYDADDRVIGARTTEQGLDHHGKPRPSYSPGMDFHAKVTVLGEGTRGTLTKSLIQKKSLDAGRNPQIWAIGVKELWRLKPENHKKGRVIHTMNFPLKFEEFGGGFIYHLDDNLAYVGMVSGLDYRDPSFDPHLALQRYKTHPAIAAMLDGGEMVRYGAKTIPEGGYWSIPKLYVDGALLIGDSASLLNPMRLKGIHLAIESGIQAAEAIFEALLANDFSEKCLESYGTRVMTGSIGQELRLARNFHQAFEHGLLPAMAFHIPLQMITKGRGIRDRYLAHPGHTRMRTLKEQRARGASQSAEAFKFDGKLTFSKLDDVYRSGTKHEENQPAHLRLADTNICNTRCKEEYGNPCQYFCPAAVYEMVDLKGQGVTELKLNPSNCVHCKTCDIMDPYQLITWVAPEGGGGPVYLGM